jgi:hypothetical protein
MVLLRIIAALATAALCLTGALAQSPGKGKQAPLPRTLDGKPDMSGVWAGPMLAQGMNLNGVQLSFKPGMEEVFYRKENGNIFEDDPTALCLPDGMPREALSPYPTQILQPPGYVVFLYEYEHFFRVVPTDGRPHPSDLELTWMGDPVGKWEGDTLVVDTVGLKPWQLDAAHNPQHWHTDALHLIERFRRTDAKSLAYELTIDDPKIFTKPWIMKWNMILHPEWKLEEQVCEENNRDLEHLRTGAKK